MNELLNHYMTGDPDDFQDMLEDPLCTPDDKLDAIVKIANGHTFRGLGGVIAGFFRNQSANKRTAKELNND